MKKMKKMVSVLLTVMMVCGMFSVVLAEEQGPTTTAIDNVASQIGKIVIHVLQIVAGAIAVGMLIYIGIKYMTKGAGAKAEVKDTLLPFLIGAMLVFFATTIAGALLPSASNFKDAKLPSETSFVEMV